MALHPRPEFAGVSPISANLKNRKAAKLVARSSARARGLGLHATDVLGPFALARFRCVVSPLFESRINAPSIVWFNSKSFLRSSGWFSDREDARQEVQTVLCPHSLAASRTYHCTTESESRPTLTVSVSM